jgi:hypothetical protein
MICRTNGFGKTGKGCVAFNFSPNAALFVGTGLSFIGKEVFLSHDQKQKRNRILSFVQLHRFSFRFSEW